MYWFTGHKISTVIFRELYFLPGQIDVVGSVADGVRIRKMAAL
jgi:hypothetical protein